MGELFDGVLQNSGILEIADPVVGLLQVRVLGWGALEVSSRCPSSGRCRGERPVVNSAWIQETNEARFWLLVFHAAVLRHQHCRLLFSYVKSPFS